MSSYLKIDRIILSSGSSEFMVYPFSGSDPNGLSSAFTGSIVRTSDGALWSNTDGNTAWSVMGSGGASNITASNTGSGAWVYHEKVGVDLRYRSIIGSGTIVVTQGANEVMLSSSIDLSNVGSAFFGTGIDGIHTLSVGVTPSATLNFSSGGTNVWVLNRDMYFEALTIDSGVFIYVNGYRIFIQGTLILNGVIGSWGTNGAAGTLSVRGAAGTGRAGTILGSSGAGQTGGSPTQVPGITVTVNPYPPGSVGAGAGGRGGANESGTLGGNAGPATLASVAEGDMKNIFQALSGRYSSGLTAYRGGAGGGGGRGSLATTGPETGCGGGGAGGGAPTVLCAYMITGSTGYIWCNGGIGGAGFAGSGGGGGGGAGWAAIVIGTGSFPTVRVSGGLGGAAGGVGLSSAGASGADGRIYQFKIGAI